MSYALVIITERLPSHGKGVTRWPWEGGKTWATGLWDQGPTNPSTWWRYPKGSPHLTRSHIPGARKRIRGRGIIGVNVINRRLRSLARAVSHAGHGVDHARQRRGGRRQEGDATGLGVEQGADPVAKELEPDPPVLVPGGGPHGVPARPEVVEVGLGTVGESAQRAGVEVVLPPEDRITVPLKLDSLIVEGTRRVKEWEQLQDEIKDAIHPSINSYQRLHAAHHFHFTVSIVLHNVRITGAKQEWSSFIWISNSKLICNPPRTEPETHAVIW